MQCKNQSYLYPCCCQKEDTVVYKNTTREFAITEKRETYNEAIREAIGFICTLESGSDGSVDITLASDDYYLEGVNHNLSIMQKLSKKYPGMNIIIEENECLRPGDVVDERLKQVRDKIREGFFNRSCRQTL